MVRAPIPAPSLVGVSRKLWYWTDVGAALTLTGASQAEIWSTPDLAHKPAAAATTAVLTLLLAVRRFVPSWCGGFALALLCLQQLFIGDVEKASAFAVVALAVATYGLGAFAPTLLSAVVGAAGMVAFISTALAKGHDPGDIAFVSVIIFGPWLAGMLIYSRRIREEQLESRADELEREAARQAQQAVEEERARIARELHDVVAHAMSVIVVQAGAERHVLQPGQESTREVLEAIERTGRQALTEMRRLLGILRATDDELGLAPQPSLAYLPDLCQQVRAAGLPVVLEIAGSPVELPAGVDVSAYRIVQEALTNALKHAGPARARVLVLYSPGNIELEVVDDGQGAPEVPAQGHGLVGMKERVAVYGGRIETTNRPSGGYAVRVRLPLEGAGT
jgi:signal transduction histidine kinase